MKKAGNILISISILFAFSFCSATKGNTKVETQEKHPFKVVKATYNNWVGGKPGSKGVKIYVAIDNTEIQLDSIYFKNMKIGLRRDEMVASHLFVGSFKNSIKPIDYILHMDPKKEFGNTPPIILKKLPFKLKENEAVISYNYKNKTNYYKIENVKKTKTIYRY